jgi:hypothetical protein
VVIPLNYWAGQRLGAVDFPQPLALTLVVMGTTWALLLPVMYRLAARLKEAEPELATA